MTARGRTAVAAAVVLLASLGAGIPAASAAPAAPAAPAGGQIPTGKWVGEAEYAEDDYVCNPGQRCPPQREFSSFCRVVYSVPEVSPPSSSTSTWTARRSTPARRIGPSVGSAPHPQAPLPGCPGRHDVTTRR
jgi:hypothetical protein